jgi:hypothetical protein
MLWADFSTDHSLYRHVYKNNNWTTGLDVDYDSTKIGNSTREQGEIVWLEYCDPPGQRQRLETLLTVTHVFLGAQLSPSASTDTMRSESLPLQQE